MPLIPPSGGIGGSWPEASKLAMLGGKNPGGIIGIPGGGTGAGAAGVGVALGAAPRRIPACRKPASNAIGSVAGGALGCLCGSVLCGGGDRIAMLA